MVPEQMAASGEAAKVSSYVKEQSPANQKSINRLRKIVKSAVPELEERMRWLQVGYVIARKDVCGIYASADHINLSFANGATMKDPRGLIEGTGKSMRRIKIFDLKNVGEDTIKSYVREAVAAVKRAPKE